MIGKLVPNIPPGLCPATGAPSPQSAPFCRKENTATLEETLPSYELSVLARRDLLPTPAVTQFVDRLRRAVNETLG